mgnify:CR=1 FL=1
MEKENIESLKQESFELLKDILKAFTNRAYNMLAIIIHDSKNLWDDALLPALEKLRDFALNSISRIGLKNEEAA